jgi:hypothetical protein
VHIMTNPSDPDLKKAELLYRRGLEKAQQRLYPEAVKDFSEAIKINPVFRAAYVSRANAQPITDEGRTLAIQDFKMVIEMHRTQGTVESIPLLEQEIQTLEREMGQNDDGLPTEITVAPDFLSDEQIAKKRRSPTIAPVEKITRNAIPPLLMDIGFDLVLANANPSELVTQLAKQKNGSIIEDAYLRKTDPTELGIMVFQVQSTDWAVIQCLNYMSSIDDDNAQELSQVLQCKVMVAALTEPNDYFGYRLFSSGQLCESYEWIDDELIDEPKDFWREVQKLGKGPSVMDALLRSHEVYLPECFAASEYGVGLYTCQDVRLDTPNHPVALPRESLAYFAYIRLQSRNTEQA